MKAVKRYFQGALFDVLHKIVLNLSADNKVKNDFQKTMNGCNFVQLTFTPESIPVVETLKSR